MSCFKRALFLNAALSFIVFSGFTQAASAQANQNIEGISVSGGSELPQVLYIVPWQPPSYQARKQHPPEKSLNGIIAPIEPVFHNEDHFFRKRLEIKLNSTAAK